MLGGREDSEAEPGTDGSDTGGATAGGTLSALQGEAGAAAGNAAPPGGTLGAPHAAR